jgi:alpha-mannosidase
MDSDPQQFCRLLNDKIPLSDRSFNYATYMDSDPRISSDYIKEFLWMYGQGDGGHGPIPVEIIVADAAEKTGLFQQVKAGVIYKLIQKSYADRLPIWNDELYLEVHRGVQTTLHQLKQQNRIAETQLLILEKFLSILQFDLDISIQNQMDNIWKKVLFNQFHDILPGSSIQEVYEDTNRDFQDVIWPGIQQIYHTGIDYFCQQSEQQFHLQNLEEQNDSNAYFIFYPHQWNLATKIQDPRKQAKDGADILTYRTKSVGIGWEILTTSSLKVAAKNLFTPQIVMQNSDQIVLQTTNYRIGFNLKTGSINSLVLLLSETQIAGSDLNALRLFEDNPKSNDAWNLDPFYREKLCPTPKMREHFLKSDDLHIQLQFSLEIGLKSVAKLTYIITSAVPYIECNLDIDWQEDHKLLRVEFDTSLNSDKFTTGIPYGWIERPTIPTTPLEKGRWEVPGQLFIDLSDQNRSCGLAILVFDRYGFHCEQSQIGISLLKAPSYEEPDKKACFWYDSKRKDQRQKIKDLGVHHIQWALYPHSQDWQAAQVIPHALSLNYPPKVFGLSFSESNSTKNINSLEPTPLQIQLNPDNVSLSVIKNSYDPEEKTLILRFIELYGKSTQTIVKWNLFVAAQITEIDLLEYSLSLNSSWNLKQDTLSFPIEPFEIKSFKICFKKD